MSPNGHFWYCNKKKQKTSPAAQRTFSLLSPLCLKFLLRWLLISLGVLFAKASLVKSVGQTGSLKARLRGETLPCIAAVLHNQKVDPQGKKKKKKESGHGINQVSCLYGCTEVIFAAVIFVKRKTLPLTPSRMESCSRLVLNRRDFSVCYLDNNYKY